jgi:hypothetical protein
MGYAVAVENVQCEMKRGGVVRLNMHTVSTEVQDRIKAIEQTLHMRDMRPLVIRSAWYSKIGDWRRWSASCSRSYSLSRYSSIQRSQKKHEEQEFRGTCHSSEQQK